MVESNVEEGILETFRRGLKNVVSDAEGVSWDDVDPIKQHKLLLMGIRNFPDIEERVTIQWYLDGDMLPALEEGAGPIQTNAGAEDGPIPKVAEIEEFYQGLEELVEQILESETFQWLKEYYESREVPFKQVYLSNMDIHLHITRWARYCDPEQPDEPRPDESAEPVTEAATAMKRELIKYPLFRNLAPFVTEFARAAEQTLKWVAEQDLEDEAVRVECMKLLKHLDSFYYNGVWRPISNRIGYYTVHGPREEKEREDHLHSLKQARRNFLQRSIDFRGRAAEQGIDIEIRSERIPRLQPDERDFSELLDWAPEDGTASPGMAAE